MEGSDYLVVAQQLERGISARGRTTGAERKGGLLHGSGLDSNFPAVLGGAPRLAGLSGIGPVAAEPGHPTPLRHDEDVLAREGALLGPSQASRPRFQATRRPVVDLLESATYTVERARVCKAQNGGGFGWGKAVSV